MIVLVGLAGAAGALTRWQLDAVLTRVLPQAWRPLSILLINVLGSGLLGVLAGHSAPVPVIAGVGFLGAFTTFSTACLLYTSPSPRDVEESRMPSSA